MVVVVPVVVIVPVHMAAGALHRSIVIALDPAAELQAQAPEAEFLVGESRKRGQVRLRRQRLGALGLEIAHLRPCAEAPGQPLRLALLDVGAHDVGAVVEARADALHAARDLQLVVVPVDDVEAEADLVDDGVVQVAQSDVEPSHATLRIEVNLDFLLLFTVIVLASARVVPVLVFLLVVTVELVRKRHAVAAVLGRHAAAREEAVAEEADAGAGVGQLGCGVRNRALRGVVVAGPPHAAAGPEQ